MQEFIDKKEFADALYDILLKWSVKTAMLVCGKSFLNQKLYNMIVGVSESASVNMEVFSDFSVNPKLKEAENAVSFHSRKSCDIIVGAGGGSALDVAKYVAIQTDSIYLAIPTTAGTGSESTPFAVLYKNGEKFSVSDIKGLPKYVLLDGGTLLTLPIGQKKATMCDALSHAVESIWSNNATQESVNYACNALRGIRAFGEGYLSNKTDCLQGILEAANFAGRAIAISKTTASHAMAYKMTTIFGFAHGEAVILTLPEMCRLLIERSGVKIKKKLSVLRDAFDVDSNEELVGVLNEYKNIIEVELPEVIGDDILDLLVGSVNVERLSNFPIRLSKDDIKAVYKKVLLCK